MVASLLAESGFCPVVIDFFADQDTKEICEGRVHRVSSFGEVLELKSCFRKVDAVVFAGGLEGAVDVAVEISKWCELAVAKPESLERTNDFRVFNQALDIAGIGRYPLLRLPDIYGQYFVRKQLTRSGSGERFLYPSGGLPRRNAFDFFQQWIEGESISMIFVASGDDVQLLGVSRQLIHSMRWVGSVAGLAIDDHDLVPALRFVRAFVDATGLQGVFGVDFVSNADGIWPVDVNPRIPASAELFGPKILQAHLAAFGFAEFESSHRLFSNTTSGKRVLFNGAVKPVRIRPELTRRYPMHHWGKKTTLQIADVPDAETIIQPKHPVLTVIAKRVDTKYVESTLRDAIEEIERDLVLEMP